MSILSAINMLEGEKKKIFDDIVSYGDMELHWGLEEIIAKILLDYDDSKLDELKEEITNSDNPIELLINKSNEMEHKKIDIPINIQV
jgi:hypothetical protein